MARRLTLLGLCALALVLLTAACTSSDESSSQGSASGSDGAQAEGGGGEGEALTVGVVAPGGGDELAQGLEQAFAGRVSAIVAPDGAEAQEAASSLAGQGAGLVVSMVPGACAAVAETRCVEPPGGGSPGPNAVVLGDAFWNRAYLLGAAAGLVTESDATGFLATGETPTDTAAVNAWALGCQSTNPNCLTRLVVLAPNADPVKAVAKLLKQGVDVLATSLADPAVCAAGAKVLAIQPVLAPGDPCGSALAATDPLAAVQPLVESALEGSWPGGTTVPLGLGEWGALVPADGQDDLDRAQASIEGGANVFAGPLFDNEGAERVPEGQSLSPDVIATQWDWLLGGVVAQ